MRLPYEIFIGVRYLRAKRKQNFISIISLISILGVTVGVAALIIVLSVMTGFEEDLRDKILGVNAHIVILKMGGGMSNYPYVVDEAKNTDGVAGTSPFIYGQAMISSRGGVVGVILRGIDVGTVEEVMVLPKKMESGSIEGLDIPLGKSRGDVGHLPGILIGKELAANLSLAVGDKVNVISPLGAMTAVGSIPRIARFEVSGIFGFGMYEYDSTMTLISLTNAQKFFRMGNSVTGVEVKVNDIYRTGSIADKIQNTLAEEGPYLVRTWMDMNKNLLSALRLERLAMFIILALIILVAAFNIVSTLIMVVMEKSKDIAILKSMGATSGGIMRIFMIQGVLIGFAGTALGTIIGLATAINLEAMVQLIERVFHFKLLPASVYYIDKLPSKVEPDVVILIILFSIGMSFLVTLYPSWQASRLDPVEAMRYE